MPTSFPAEAIWNRLDPAGPWKGDWYDFRHRQQGEFLHELAKFASFDVGLSHIGLSDEGRVLHTLRFGRGKRRVLVWARQHGDEPDCSAGLAMALFELVMRPEEPHNALILEKLELGIFPMVNPDGVAKFTRRNAQGIDLNRDAVALATPEARGLKAIQESLKPEFCFNLHDMGPRKSTRDGKLVALAFQAGPFEPRDIDNDVRRRAKAVIARMNDAAAAHAAGHIGKYTADYMHRAFGDSMMRWGVSSILIEAGGWYADRGGDDFVRRLFALSLLRGLYAVAAGEDDPATAAEYDAIPFDSGAKFADVLLEKGQVLNGSGRPPFRADLALNILKSAGRTSEPPSTVSAITLMGDLEDELAKSRRDIAGHVLMPGFIAVCPAARFEAEIPSPREAAAFLRAGITSLVCGFGPFASNRAREQWMESCFGRTPPLNIIPFERVSSIREIRSRHGMTEFAGLLVQDLAIAPEDLLHFAHLFHSAQHSAIDGDSSSRLIGVDLLFQGSSSPSKSRIHLHLTPIAQRSGHAAVRSDEIRLLADEFLHDPSQITLSTDALEAPFDWLPMLVGYGGLSHGRLAEPAFFGNILKHYGAEDSSGVVAALNMLTLINARAFRLQHSGRIDLDCRGDLVAFGESILAGGAAAHAAQPDLVLLNGETVVDRAAKLESPGTGMWQLASAPMQR